MDLNWPSPFGDTVASAARAVMAHMIAARQLRQNSMVARIIMTPLTSRIESAGTTDSHRCDGLKRITPIDPPHLCESVVSEFDSELELEYARQVHLSGGLAEACAPDVRIDASQTNVIEQVVRIAPKHEPQIFADLKISGKTYVLIKEVRVSHPIAPRPGTIALPD